MTRGVAIALGALALALAGGAVYLVRRRPSATVVAGVGGGFGGPGATVYGMERAHGIDARLLAFLAEWRRSGLFPLTVGQDGGLRTDEATQARLFASGASRAATLEETAHGHGGGLDVLPADVVGGYSRGALDSPELRKRLGEAGESFGLVWGGQWTGLLTPTASNPDGADPAHFEVFDWRALPMPTASYA